MEIFKKIGWWGWGRFFMGASLSFLAICFLKKMGSTGLGKYQLSLIPTKLDKKIKDHI